VTTALVRHNAGTVVKLTLEMLQDVVEEFTASSASSTTVVAPASSAASDSDDTYNNMWVYVYQDTGAGGERRISDYTGSTRTVTVPVAWGTSPDSTSEVLISRDYRPSLVFRVVQDVIRELTSSIRTPITDTSLVVGNILVNPHFQDWDSSSNVSSGSFIYTRWASGDGWSVRETGAVGSRESTVVRNVGSFDAYSGEMVSDGSNAASFRQAVPNWARWANETFDLRGWVYTGTGSRVNLRMLDGTQTLNTDVGGSSGTHSGTASWEQLERQQFTTSVDSTQLLIECIISSGGALTARFDKVRLLPNNEPDFYRIPGHFSHIQDIFVERGIPILDSTTGQPTGGRNEGQYFTEPISPRGYHIVFHDDGHPYLHFDRGIWLPRDHGLMITGQGYRTDTIAVGTDIEINPYLVATLTASRVIRVKDRESSIMYSDLLGRAERMKHASPRGRVLPGSKLVRG
jgi:hypothetical protein